MRRFNQTEINAGALAVRSMSDKARSYYSSTSPLFVAEYEGEDGETLYAYGEDGGIAQRSGLYFDQIDADFSKLFDIVNTLDDDE